MTEADQLILLGKVSLAQGDDNNAIHLFTEALRVNPLASQAYLERGRILLRLGELKSGLEDLTHALKLFLASSDLESQFEEVLNEYLAVCAFRGRLLYDKGDYIGAVADFTKVIDLDTGSTEIRRCRALALVRLKRIDDALADLDHIIANRPGDLNALYFRGIL
jgi:tetratricopeptide (TPR) repeat protein